MPSHMDPASRCPPARLRFQSLAAPRLGPRGPPGPGSCGASPGRLGKSQNPTAPSPSCAFTNYLQSRQNRSALRFVLISRRMKKMKPTFLGRFLMAALLLGAGVAAASNKDNVNVPQSDADIAKHVRHEVLMYPYYSIWDDVTFRVDHGQVELLGAVSQPFKKSDIDRLVRQVPGVTSLTDELRVLPLSGNDDLLRRQVARSIC